MPKATILNLFWRADATVLPKKRAARVALESVNVFDERPPVPAVLLYPAFLTPAVHVQGDHDGMFEILLLARESPALTASDVNLHLKITKGLDPLKKASDQPLFANPKDNILLEVVKPNGDGIIATKNVFKGQLHLSARRRLANDAGTKPLGTFYAVRINDTCLADKAVVEGGSRTPTKELQDASVLATLTNMNGPELREKDNRGTHCFATVEGAIDMSNVDQGQPIVAYHPLCFYPAASLAPASFGHVSDIHINARQEILRRSPARVIDDPAGLADSPPIGDMLNVCSFDFHAILTALGNDDRMDILLAGGDYIDHIHNVYPFRKGNDPQTFAHMTPKAVWDLMDLRDDHGFNTNYQAFVDLIYFFGEMRWFYDTFSKPVYGITGNHDCYEGAFGISPRKLGVRANEGIPADHNLTFYEAILVFGETWDVLRRNSSPFTAALFEWYYSVLTPWSDFAIDLPKQRLAALAWGEDEEIISGPGSFGQGLTHLPRAEEAVTDAQLALFNDGLGSAKKTVLLTHFTFVSYLETVRELDSTDAHELDVAGPGLLRRGDPFSPFDMGTFELNRRALYTAVADPSRVQFVVTGHSHRKGLYFLGARSGDHFATEMHGLLHPVAPSSLPNGNARTPIVVSDSAGPLPRRNFDNEFLEWGSDRPAGTLIQVGTDDRVARIEAVPVPLGGANSARAKPRLCVALEYLHVSKNSVFDEIETLPFDKTKANTVAHGLTFTFKSEFPSGRCRLDAVTLYCRSAVSAPWRQIPLVAAGTFAAGKITFKVPLAAAPLFMEWLQMAPKSGRFMSMKFRTTDGGLAGVYDDASAWNIEVDARPARTNIFHLTNITFVVIPQGGSDRDNPRPVVEAPSFVWRQRFPEYQ